MHPEIASRTQFAVCATALLRPTPGPYTWMAEADNTNPERIAFISTPETESVWQPLDLKSIAPYRQVLIAPVCMVMVEKALPSEVRRHMSTSDSLHYKSGDILHIKIYLARMIRHMP
jgi:hypothetical protein